MYKVGIAERETSHAADGQAATLDTGKIGPNWAVKVGSMPETLSER